MENAFYIATCRFHVKEKDRLLITGYFLDNRPDGNRIEIRLDGKKLFYTTDGIRLHPLKFRKIRRLERSVQTGSIAVVSWKRRIDEDLCSQ